MLRIPPADRCSVDKLNQFHTFSLRSTRRVAGITLATHTHTYTHMHIYKHVMNGAAESGAFFPAARHCDHNAHTMFCFIHCTSFANRNKFLINASWWGCLWVCAVRIVRRTTCLCVMCVCDFDSDRATDMYRSIGMQPSLAEMAFSRVCTRIDWDWWHLEFCHFKNDKIAQNRILFRFDEIFR